MGIQENCYKDSITILRITFVTADETHFSLNVISVLFTFIFIYVIYKNKSLLTLSLCSKNK